MKPSEIISEDLKKRGEDPQEVLQAINQMIQDDTAKLLQKNNSVLLIKKIDAGIAELHLFTTDGMMSLARSLKYFDEKLATSGLTAVYGEATNPEIIDLMKKVGIEVIESDLPQYNWKVQYGRS